MDNPKLQRVCVSSWSFHTAFERDKDNPGKVLMDILDFPEMIADRYHVHNIEVVLPHFVNPDPRRVAEFKARLDKAHSRVVNMPLDFGVLWNKPAISSTDAAEREARRLSVTRSYLLRFLFRQASQCTNLILYKNSKISLYYNQP